MARTISTTAIGQREVSPDVAFETQLWVEAVPEYELDVGAE